MGRLFLGSVLAAVAMFMWGFVFYVVSPAMGAVIKTVDDTAATQAVLREHFTESGTYFIPGPDLPEEQMNRLHQAGPLVMIHIRQEGAPPMDPMVLFWGFVHQWVTCLLLGLLLMKAAPALAGYWARAGFLTLAGFAAALFIDYGATIWWLTDRGFALTNLVHDTLAWSVAGLVLAWQPGAGPAAG
jgi:hypothetical protein